MSLNSSRRRSGVFLGLLVVSALLMTACGSDVPDETERLTQLVEEQQLEIDKRQNAAEICEELFEAEQQRYLRLERWTRMDFVDPLDDRVLDDSDLKDVSDEARVRIQDQISFYQLKVAGQFDELIAMNEELKREVSKVGRSVNAEAESIRRASQSQTQVLSSQMTENTERMDQYLESTRQLSVQVESLIGQVQGFDRTQINCPTCFGKSLGKKKERQLKQEEFQRFVGNLIEDLAKLQSAASAAGTK